MNQNETFVLITSFIYKITSFEMKISQLLRIKKMHNRVSSYKDVVNLRTLSNLASYVISQYRIKKYI